MDINLNNILSHAVFSWYVNKTLFVVFLPSNNHDKLYAQVLLYKVLALKLSIF